MSHYTLSEIGSIDELRQMFSTGRADELNWCFLSTSGVHGSYNRLDAWTEDNPNITVLVVAPRMVRVRYGDFPISVHDIPWLRRLVDSSLEAVERSQKGNRVTHEPLS